MSRREGDPSIHSSWGDQDAGTQIQCPPSLMVSLCRPNFPEGKNQTEVRKRAADSQTVKDQHGERRCQSQRQAF